MMSSVLILSPLSIEFKALMDRFTDHGFVAQEELIGRIKVYHYQKLNFKLAIGGHGKTQFAVQAQYLMGQIPNLSALICAGCAGGIDDILNIGDVVIAEKTIEHDYNLKFVKKDLPSFFASQELLQMVSSSVINTQKKLEFKIHFGIVASGDEDVVDVKRALEIKNSTNALAVAWEGAGGARAASFSQIKYIEVRGVTDLANSNAVSEFSKNLKTTMNNVADVLIDSFGDKKN